MGMPDAVAEFKRRYDFGSGFGHAFKVRDLAPRILDEARRLGLHATFRGFAGYVSLHNNQHISLSYVIRVTFFIFLDSVKAVEN